MKSSRWHLQRHRANKNRNLPLLLRHWPGQSLDLECDYSRSIAYSIGLWPVNGSRPSPRPRVGLHLFFISKFPDFREFPENFHPCVSTWLVGSWLLAPGFRPPPLSGPVEQQVCNESNLLLVQVLVRGSKLGRGRQNFNPPPPHTHTHVTAWFLFFLFFQDVVSTWLVGSWLLDPEGPNGVGAWRGASHGEVWVKGTSTSNRSTTKGRGASHVAGGLMGTVSSNCSTTKFQCN